MGVGYLWDTNTVIYYLQQQFSPAGEKFIDEVLSESRPNISAITEIELLCWKTTTEKDVEVLHGFIHECNVIELEQAVKVMTADLRKKHKIKLPDAIIAATALVYEFTLITNNEKDFSNIQGLRIINPGRI